jgi:hypothetical protein
VPRTPLTWVLIGIGALALIFFLFVVRPRRFVRNAVGLDAASRPGVLCWGWSSSRTTLS